MGHVSVGQPQGRDAALGRLGALPAPRGFAQPLVLVGRIAGGEEGSWEMVRLCQVL